MGTSYMLGREICYAIYNIENLWRNERRESDRDVVSNVQAAGIGTIARALTLCLA